MWQRVWASVVFCGEGGRYEDFLRYAAESGARLRKIEPQAGGFSAGCAAWEYMQLARMARRYHVRVRLMQKRGLLFLLRPVLLCKGILLGIFTALLSICYLQNTVLFLDDMALCAARRPQIQQILWDNGLAPGNVCTERKLARAEYAAMATGEYAWLSINFERGRITVEAAVAQQAPQIYEQDERPLLAKKAGTIQTIQLKSGTPAVCAGQAVAQGQLLIGTTRAERDGTPVVRAADGQVLAYTEWEYETSVPLQEELLLAGARKKSAWCLQVLGRSFCVGEPPENSEEWALHTTHHQLTLLGLPLPAVLECRTYRNYENACCSRTESLAFALAKQSEVQALAREWPGAEIAAQQTTSGTVDGVFYYKSRATILADLCVREE